MLDKNDKSMYNHYSTVKKTLNSHRGQVCDMNMNHIQNVLIMNV